MNLGGGGEGQVVGGARFQVSYEEMKKHDLHEFAVCIFRSLIEQSLVGVLCNDW